MYTHLSNLLYCESINLLYLIYIYFIHSIKIKANKETQLSTST